MRHNCLRSIHHVLQSEFPFSNTNTKYKGFGFSNPPFSLGTYLRQRKKRDEAITMKCDCTEFPELELDLQHCPCPSISYPQLHLSFLFLLFLSLRSFNLLMCLCRYLLIYICISMLKHTGQNRCIQVGINV
jgi:hypothetical protein